MISRDSLNPSSSPERREQTAAFLDQFWKGGEAVGVHGTSWYDVALAAWLAACDWIDPPNPPCEFHDYVQGRCGLQRDEHTALTGWAEGGPLYGYPAHSFTMAGRRR